MQCWYKLKFYNPMHNENGLELGSGDGGNFGNALKPLKSVF